VHPLFILLALLAIIFTIKWVKAQPPQKRQHAGFMAALAGAGALLLVALATGRLNPLVAMVAAAIPILQRLTRAKSLFDGLRSSMKGDSTSGPVISTSRLRIEVNQKNGDWTGMIIDGPYKGQALSTLDLAQLSDLLTEYERVDPESAALLASYLERHHHGYRRASGAHSSSRTATSTMSEREARQVLGLDEAATDEEIIATHRRLMQKMHPDRGGSDYLASKVNQAKGRLLSRS
jgi:hypothetical protein